MISIPNCCYMRLGCVANSVRTTRHISIWGPPLGFPEGSPGFWFSLEKDSIHMALEYF